MTGTLKFGKATSNEGFTPHSTASFSDLRPARIVRELIQNSLDAAVLEAGEDTAIMRFEVETITRGQVPDLRGYRAAFKSATQRQTKFSDGALPDAAQQVVDHIENGLTAVRTGNASVLSVADNGIGLDDKRMSSLLGDGSSAKSAESSGSYGVGHLAPMSLSDIRYMLYGGVTQNGRSIVAGRTVLASHGIREVHAAQGYLINDFRSGRNGSLYDFIRPRYYPPIMQRRLDRISSEWGHGTVVMILVFNNFRSDVSLWDIVSKIASYNFVSAIYQGKLIIEVDDGNKRRILDKHKIKHVLDQEKERVRVARSDSFFEGLRPSGNNAYSILRTLAQHPRRPVETKLGTAYLSLMKESPSGRARVDLFRNGMWITDRADKLKRADFANRQPFHAVVEVQAKESGQLHRLVRKAEGPMHDTIAFSLLSRDEKKKLREALTQLADEIKKVVPEVGNEGYTVDDFLLVSQDSIVGEGRRSYSFWGIPTAASRSRSSQIIPGIEPIDVEPEGEPKSPSPLPHRPPPSSRKQTQSRPLPFKSAIVPDGRGKLIASIQSNRDFAEVWFVLRVDENTDVTCDRIWQDEDVSISSFKITPSDDDGSELESEILDGGRAVSVRRFSRGITYDVDIEYATSPDLNTSVGEPVFRLEVHRRPNRRKAQEKDQSADDA